MKRKLCALSVTLLLAPLALAQGGAPDVEVRKLAEHSYELVLKTRRTKEVAQGQKELLPTAKRLCGALHVQLGGYQYSVSEPLLTGAAAGEPAVLLLKQQIRCESTATSPATAASSASAQEASNTATAWQPGEAEKTQVALLTQQYFRHKDRGDYSAAYAMLSPDMQRGTSLERWSVQRADFSARAGEVKDRSIRKITWYKDPPSTPLRGVFAAVDHAGVFQNIDIHCGVLMWHQQPNGSFKLLREEEHSIDKATQGRMSAEQVAAARKTLRC